jgi:hypothetical protein
MDNELHALDTQTIFISYPRYGKSLVHEFMEVGTKLHEAIENAQRDGVSATRILLVDDDIQLHNICADEMMNKLLLDRGMELPDVHVVDRPTKLRRKAQRKGTKPWNR